LFQALLKSSPSEDDQCSLESVSEAEYVELNNRIILVVSLYACMRAWWARFFYACVQYCCCPVLYVGLFSDAPGHFLRIQYEDRAGKDLFQISSQKEVSLLFW